MAKPFLLLFLLAVSGFASCNKEEGCINFGRAKVTTVTGPTTVAVNQLVTLIVAFQVNNGCGQFNEFVTTENGNTLLVEVDAIYDGCACTMDMPVRQVSFNFTGHQAGTYTLKFMQTSGVYIDHVITVQ